MDHKRIINSYYFFFLVLFLTFISFPLTLNIYDINNCYPFYDIYKHITNIL